MNYGERELINQRLGAIERKIIAPKEIVFHLNDYSEQTEKNYYFNFEVVYGGFIKFEVQASNDCTLTLGGVEIKCGEYFYLEKGVYEVLVQTQESDPTKEVRVSVLGEVNYHDSSQYKVLSQDSYSIIALICAGQLSIYFYDGNVVEIDRIQTDDYDMVLGEELTVYYLTQTGFEKKVYMFPFSVGVVTSYTLDDISGIKCSNSGVYVIKSGKMYLLEVENGLNFRDCNLEVKDIFAIKDNKVVYRDYNGKIKLSDFSVSP